MSLRHFKKKKKEILKTFLLFDCVCPFSKFCGHELSDMTNFEKFHGHNLSGKGLKTSKPRKFLSAKASSLKVYSQNEVTNKQSNRFRVVFISLLIANCHSNLSSIKNVIHI